MLPKNQQEIIEFANICQVKSDGRLHAPMLYSHKKVTSGKITYIYWQILMGIHKEPVNMDDIINRTTNYNGIPYIITRSGQMPTESNPEPRVRLSKRTYIKTGKNIGKKNFTTSLTQAVNDAKSKYKKKVKDGFVEDRNDIIVDYTFDDLMNRQVSYPWRVIPMALKDVRGSNNWNYVKYPCYVQRKLDGTRLILVGHGSGIDAYSRSREERRDKFVELIKEELHDILMDNPGLYFDGEFYKHGASLQETAGKSRQIHDDDNIDNNVDNVDNADNIDNNLDNADMHEKFYIFDCFTIPSKPYNERKKQLQEIFKKYDNFKYCTMVNSVVVNNKEELMEQYEDIIKDYEGVVIRNFSSMYEYGLYKEVRSYGTMKLKPRFDTEFDVIGYTQGKKGKEIGAIVWVCSINNSSMNYMINTFIDKYPNMAKTLEEVDNHGVSREFTVTPNITYDERYALFRYLEDHDDESYKNKMATIEFASTSLYAKPQQPKFVRFRDMDYNKDLLDKASTYYNSLS